MANQFKIYNLRIVPPPPIFEEVQDFKTQFIDRFGKQAYSKSKPHITLSHFTMNTRYVESLIAAFSALSSVKRFTVEINGFSSFEGRGVYVLFLRVPVSKEIKELHHLITSLWLNSLQSVIASPGISKIPHMTISKTKDKKMLEESLKVYGKIFYRQQFEVRHLSLLSRPNGNTWDWEHAIELQ